MNALITGGHGMLGQALAGALQRFGADVVALSREDLDVTDSKALRTAVIDAHPDVVLHCAAYTRVDDAEADEPKAFDVNARSVETAATACNEIGARLLYPSSDYVFDGTATAPYATDAPTAPRSAYGRSKVAGEAAATTAWDYLVVRTSWLYGPGGRNFVRTIANRLRGGDPVRVVTDQVGGLTWTHDAADMMVALLAARAPRGIYHATNAGIGSWFDIACEIARLTGADGRVTPCTTADYPTPARRPAFSALDCSRTEQIVGPRRHWKEALAQAMASGAY